MPQLVICDIDATLVNEKKELTPRTKEALIKLHEKGIYFGIASGRPADELKRNKEEKDSPLILKSNFRPYNSSSTFERIFASSELRDTLF